VWCPYLIFSPDDSENKPLLPSNNTGAGQTLRQLRDFVLNAFSAVSELSFLFQLAFQNKVGVTFVIIWLMQILPILDDDSERMWQGNRSLVIVFQAELTSDLGCIYYAVNQDYLRLQTLKEMVSTEDWRHEIISGTLDNYILSSTYLRLIVDAH
jgi:hypothetical protein